MLRSRACSAVLGDLETRNSDTPSKWIRGHLGEPGQWISMIERFKPSEAPNSETIGGDRGASRTSR